MSKLYLFNKTKTITVKFTELFFLTLPSKIHESMLGYHNDKNKLL